MKLDSEKKTLEIDPGFCPDPSLVQPEEYLAWIAQFVNCFCPKIPRTLKAEAYWFLEEFFMGFEEEFLSSLGEVPDATLGETDGE